MGERGVRNAEVRGSIPLISTYPSKIIVNFYLIPIGRLSYTNSLGNKSLNPLFFKIFSFGGRWL